MPKIAYTEQRFNSHSRFIIATANDIIEEYQGQGYSLTLRQLYYQFVARGHVENSVRSYKSLGGIINNGRLCGLIDWYAIEDRTRNLAALAHWDSPKDIVDACAQQFRIDKWEGQDQRVEVWVEKEALTGVVSRVCNKWDVPYFACRGYVSQSEQWRAAQRFHRYESAGQSCLVIHLGDHDPSGIDMTRDNIDRFDLFGANTEVHRIALNMDQVEAHKPPPNPAKLTDSRAQGYIARFGHESWELDALEPKVISTLIEDRIMEVIDLDLFREDERTEREGREAIAAAAETL